MRNSSTSGKTLTLVLPEVGDARERLAGLRN